MLYKNFIKPKREGEMAENGRIRTFDYANKKATFPSMIWESYEIIELHRFLSHGMEKRPNAEMCSSSLSMLNKHNAQFMLPLEGEYFHWTTHKSGIKWSYAHIKMHPNKLLLLNI